MASLRLPRRVVPTQPRHPRTKGQIAQVESQQSQHPPVSARDQALLAYAKKVATFLRSYDKRWRMDIELLPARYVKVSTSIGGNKGPTLRLALLTMLPEDQAAIIHEAAVGRSQARVDIRDYRQRKAAVRERKNARRRLKRATDTEWCASERQKRLEREARQKTAADLAR